MNVPPEHVRRDPKLHLSEQRVLDILELDWHLSIQY
jgi:hypothetical protein